MLILGTICVTGLIYGICEMVKGEEKDICQMIEEEYREEEKLKNEFNELKERYLNRIAS